MRSWKTTFSAKHLPVIGMSSWLLVKRLTSMSWTAHILFQVFFSGYVWRKGAGNGVFCCRSWVFLCVSVLQTATDSSSNSSQKKEHATQLVATSTFYEPHPHRCILQYRPPERYSLDQVREWYNPLHLYLRCLAECILDQGCQIQFSLRPWFVLAGWFLGGDLGVLMRSTCTTHALLELMKSRINFMLLLQLDTTKGSIKDYNWLQKSLSVVIG